MGRNDALIDKFMLQSKSNHAILLVRCKNCKEHDRWKRTILMRTRGERREREDDIGDTRAEGREATEVRTG